MRGNSIHLTYIQEPFKSYDRTLLFFTPPNCPELPQGFLRAFHQLAFESARSISLNDETFVDLHDKIKVTAISTSKGEEDLELSVDDDSIPHFVWTGAASYWLSCFEKLRALSSSRGHQFLIEGTSAETQIIVSSGEYMVDEFA